MSAARYLTLDDVDPAGLRVLVRSDLNVPLAGGVVDDDFRILAALPTLERLVAAGAAVTVCSHLGRPVGADAAYSMGIVAERMNEISTLDVALERPADITVLENTRFNPGETENAPEYAAELADGYELFVQDAFGSVHRAHASTVGVAERVRSVGGPLLDSELSALGRFLGEPDQPYVVVLGGAKVSDKLAVIENLLPRVDAMLIGGGMCFTLLAAKGFEVGGSLLEEEMIDRVRPMVEGSDREKIILPLDIVVATEFSADAGVEVVGAKQMEPGQIGLDIGPETSMLFASVIRTAEMVFWNGPMGVFEFASARQGTEAVARAMAETSGFSAVGGGDSAAALRELRLESDVAHLSTGGGASLELLEGRELPGVAVLERWLP
jgi:phosphoglycerate kinase